MEKVSIDKLDSSFTALGHKKEEMGKQSILKSNMESREDFFLF